MIDYNQDIAPLRQQYFPMLTGERGFDQAMKFRQDVLMPMQQHTMKMQQHQMNMRQQELAYKDQKFKLRQARISARRENEAMDRLPEVINQINGILDDPDKGVFDQQRDLAKLQMQYTPIAKFSPLVNNLFNSASKSVDARYKQQESVSGFLYQAAVSGVDPDTVRQQAEADGVVTPREQISIDIANSRTKVAAAKTEEERQKLEREQSEKLEKARVTEGKDIITSLLKIVPDAQDVFGSGDFLNADNAKILKEHLAKADKDQAAYHRSILESAYYRSLPFDKQLELDMSGKSLDDFTDHQLFNAAYNRASRMQIPASLKQNKPSIIASKFMPETSE